MYMIVSFCYFWRLYLINSDIILWQTYRGADKSLARRTSRFILFDGENISFDASLIIYIYMYK